MCTLNHVENHLPAVDGVLLCLTMVGSSAAVVVTEDGLKAAFDRGSCMLVNKGRKAIQFSFTRSHSLPNAVIPSMNWCIILAVL